MLNITTIEKRLGCLSESRSAAFAGKPMNINTAICMSIVLRSRSSRFYGGRVLFTYQNKSSVVKNKFAVCLSVRPSVCLSVTRISDCYMQRGMRVTYRPHHPHPPHKELFILSLYKAYKVSAYWGGWHWFSAEVLHSVLLWGSGNAFLDKKPFSWNSYVDRKWRMPTFIRNCRKLETTSKI